MQEGFRLLKKEDADSINSYEDAFNNFQDFQAMYTKNLKIM
jgi:hypothetical protein